MRNSGASRPNPADCLDPRLVATSAVSSAAGAKPQAAAPTLRRRPDVQLVLNVGEEPSRWTATTPLNPADRWDNKGEGSDGMDVSEITEEARWVIERLQAGQRVLVHCAAGMNRSAAICCAVLILLEGLSAEAALERVREHHPWARPDSHHWLVVRWLAHAANAPTSR